MYREILVAGCTSGLLLSWLNKTTQNPVSAEYAQFRFHYLSVYALVLMSDWLQGAYSYSLYKSHGHDLDTISYLFIVGFLSSAVCGVVAGSWMDYLGRKKTCLLFCIIYTAACLCITSSSLNINYVGRVCGGLGTSLLWSAFESWVITAHAEKGHCFHVGFPKDTLSELFSKSTLTNGLVAIVSGVLSNVLVDYYGYTGPYWAAIGFLIFSFVGILGWSENHGSSTRSSGSFALNWTICSVGIMQSCMESSMYVFVFLWSPVLENLNSTILPFGIIFSTFMVSMMIGSLLFNPLSARWANATILFVAFGLASLGFALMVHATTEWAVYLGMNLFEASCGLYFPAISTLRSQVIPESSRSMIMNLFRIPLNLMVVGILVYLKDFTPLFYALTLVAMILAGLHPEPIKNKQE